jgi:hypothetical protein
VLLIVLNDAFINENDGYIIYHTLCKKTREVLGREDYFLALKHAYEVDYFGSTY